MVRPTTLCLLGVLALQAAAEIPLSIPADDDRPAESAVVASMRDQIAGREYASVAAQAERLVADIESRTDRYDPALVEPLTLLGDARLGMDQHQTALDAYDRAKHVLRIAEGPQSLEQLRLLYREAVALDALGDRSGANERHEFAYSLRRREHGDDTLELLPAINDLIAWYRHHYKFRPAQILYESALDILRDNYEPDDPGSSGPCAATWTPSGSAGSVRERSAEVASGLGHRA